MAYAYNPTTREAKIGPLRDLDYSELQSEFQASICNTLNSSHKNNCTNKHIEPIIFKS